MTDIIDRATAALEGITEGPWKAVNVGNIHWGVTHGDYNFPTVVQAQCSYDGYGNGSNRADAQFIAAAPDLIRELVGEIERLHDLIRRGLAYGDAFRSPAAAGARANLRISAGMSPPNRDTTGLGET